MRDKKPTGTRQPQAGRMGWELKGGRVLQKDISWRGAQTYGGTVQETEIATAHIKVLGAKGCEVSPSWKDLWVKIMKSREV